MSDFDFQGQDFSDSDAFLASAGQNQTNFTQEGQKLPLRTTSSETGPRATMTVVDLSNAAMNAAVFKPAGAVADIYNRVGQDVVAMGMAENGGPTEVLGGALPIAPTDLIIKADLLDVPQTNDFSALAGGDPAAAPGTGTGNVDMGNYPPPPAGGYRGTSEMRKIYSIDGAGTPPYGGAGEGIIVSFKWWTGPTYSVHKSTVPVWTIINDIMKRWNYGPRPEETGGGGYNRRKITGGSGWSLHAYGIAVDINPTKNPYGPRLISDMPSGMIAEILEIKTAAGVKAVRWGGHYTTNKDAMHFEVVATPGELAAGVSQGGQPTSLATTKAGGGTSRAS